MLHPPLPSSAGLKHKKKECGSPNAGELHPGSPALHQQSCRYDLRMGELCTGLIHSLTHTAWT